MRVTQIDAKLGERPAFTLGEYSSPRDFLRAVSDGRKLCYDSPQSKWAGGTYDYFKRGMVGGVDDYMGAADKLVTQFGNVAISEFTAGLDANLVHGVLDYGAAMAGDPMCMYGATITETDRAPVEIYVDPWVNHSVSADAVQKRGIAVLALVSALAVYRPVNAYILKTSCYSPRRANTIQTLAIPTQPMDLSRASFMLCSPTVNRHGLLHSIYKVHKCRKHCGSPPFSSGWADRRAGAWLAERHGTSAYIHLKGMRNDNGFWSTETDTVAWIKRQLEKYVAKK